jgi:hypothetical protein
MKKYLTRKEVAELYPLSASLLARLASRGEGPVFYKPVDVALYRPEDIDAWIEASPATVSKGRRGRKTDSAASPVDRLVRVPGRGRKSLPLSEFSSLKLRDLPTEAEGTG